MCNLDQIWNRHSCSMVQPGLITWWVPNIWTDKSPSSVEKVPRQPLSDFQTNISAHLGKDSPGNGRCRRWWWSLCLCRSPSENTARPPSAGCRWSAARCCTRAGGWHIASVPCRIPPHLHQHNAVFTSAKSESNLDSELAQQIETRWHFGFDEHLILQVVIYQWYETYLLQCDHVTLVLLCATLSEDEVLGRLHEAVDLSHHPLHMVTKWILPTHG